MLWTSSSFTLEATLFLSLVVVKNCRSPEYFIWNPFILKSTLFSHLSYLHSFSIRTIDNFTKRHKAAVVCWLVFFFVGFFFFAWNENKPQMTTLKKYTIYIYNIWGGVVRNPTLSPMAGSAFQISILSNTCITVWTVPPSCVSAITHVSGEPDGGSIMWGMSTRRMAEDEGTWEAETINEGGAHVYTVGEERSWK